MATFQYKGQGVRSVGAYQVSGTPWITGSANLDDDKVHRIKFPYVTKSFTVINQNDASTEKIRVHFQSGSNVGTMGGTDHPGAMENDNSDDVINKNHYITIPAGASMTFDVKCADVYVSQNTGVANLEYQIIADLTTIARSHMWHLTGSGITE